MHSSLLQLIAALSGVQLGLASLHSHSHGHKHVHLHSTPQAPNPLSDSFERREAAVLHVNPDGTVSEHEDPLVRREAAILHVNPDGSISEHEDPELHARSAPQYKKVGFNKKVPVPNCNSRYMNLIKAAHPRQPKRFCTNYRPKRDVRKSPIKGFPTAQALVKACSCFLKREAALTANARHQRRTTTRKMTTTVKVVSSSALSTTPVEVPPTVSASAYTTDIQVTTTKSTIDTSAPATVAAPAQTGAGTVSGCTKWYVAVPGDYCYLIATNNNIPVDTFMSWNPSVNPPNCNTLYAGYAYCVATTATGSAGDPDGGSPAPPSSVASSPAGYSGYPPSSSAAAPTSYPSVTPNGYRTYSGDGTVGAGWPTQESWLSYDEMWDMNMPVMQQSCANWNVPLNTDAEIGYINSSIQAVAGASGVDARFILAIVLQESNGCVRVITTAWGHANPGLMQSNQGTGSCNMGGTVQTPCPEAEILQMIKDGTEGTASGDGLSQCIGESGSSGVDKYYKGARIYNGGINGWDKTNLGAGCCTKCYSSDVANRLTGWHAGASGCTL